MKLEDISVSIECEIISKNDETKFYFDNVKYEVSFVFPIKSKDRILFDKITNYFITQSIENSKVITTDVRFQLYYIELYENAFKKAIEDFKQITFLSIDNELKEDILVKAFEKIIYFSVKSYDQACSYLNSDRYRDRKATFRQYCGLESSGSKQHVN